MFPRTRFNWHLIFKARNIIVSNVKCFLQTVGLLCRVFDVQRKEMH